MEDKIDYGRLNKRIVFTENDHRHVNFLMKLKSVGLTQSKFFRYIITGFINDDERLYDFIEEISEVSKKKKLLSRRLKEKGAQQAVEIGLNENEVDNIFDLIAEEFPTL